MVEIVYKDNDVAEAVKKLDIKNKAIKKNKDDSKEVKNELLTEDVIVFNKGNKALDNGNYSEAIERFQEAIQLNPNYERAWNCLGFILQKFKKYDEAIDCYKKAIEINPMSKAANNVGLTLSMMGDNIGAMEYLDMATRFNPDSAEGWQNKGIVYQKMGKTEASIVCFDKVLELKPDSIKTYVSKGVSYQKIGDYEKAYHEFDNALKVDPFYVQAWNSKGITLQKLDKFQDAIYCFDKALEIDPKNIKALNSKAFTYQRLENFDKALEVYLKVAIMEDGYNHEAFNGIATCKAKLGDFKESLEYYNKILKNEKNPSRIAKTNKSIDFIVKLKAKEELSDNAEQAQKEADKKNLE